MLTSLRVMTYKPLSANLSFFASMNDGVCKIQDEKDRILELKCSSFNDELTMDILRNDQQEDDNLLLVAVEYILGHNSELQKIRINNHTLVKNHKNILQKYFSLDRATLKFSRSEFFQLRALWHKERDYDLKIEKWTTSNDRLHPERLNIQSGVLYRRYVPSIEKSLSFRMIDIDGDLDIFHDWHNQPRVANFWELASPKEELRQYIEKSLKDPHTLPMIAECDGVPVGYFEMYWTREDRLAPYYPSEAFDRGFHFLIGNVDFLGFKNTDATLKCLSHFLFLDEIRTRKIMAEPRSDNHKVLKYIETFTAWKKLYEFDFPHKRAALLECTREVFFMEQNL
jgi:acetyl CoA:N6-hydroxylysine acetyl transferase